MKKSLIALAALGAFAGAASAQSSVTLYGLIDLSYQHIKSGDATANAGSSINKMADGTEWGPGSRWGLRVSEDLGSGLKANVVLESGFSADTGASAQSGRLFGRQAFVSLASNVAGEVRLGRQYTLGDETVVLNNPFGNTTFLHAGVYYSTSAAGSTSTLAAPSNKLPLFIDAPRVDNAVQYISPSFGGFRVQGMVAAGEGTTDRYQALKGLYANGPLNVALAYEQNKSFAGRAAAAGVRGFAVGDTVNKVWTLSGNYDFGVARLYAGYQDGKDLLNGTTALPGSSGNLIQAAGTGFTTALGTVDKLKTYTVGVAVPFGAITLGANYTRAKYDTVTGTDFTLGRGAVGATYALSKLTTVYTAVEVATGDLKDRVLEKRGFEVGLRKAF